jgi:hypothetical protein
VTPQHCAINETRNQAPCLRVKAVVDELVLRSLHAFELPGGFLVTVWESMGDGPVLRRAPMERCGATVGGQLVRFLQRFQVSFEGGAVIALSVEFGLEALDEQLEAANLATKLLSLDRRTGRPV